MVIEACVVLVLFPLHAGRSYRFGFSVALFNHLGIIKVDYTILSAAESVGWLVGLTHKGVAAQLDQRSLHLSYSRPERLLAHDLFYHLGRLVLSGEGSPLSLCLNFQLRDGWLLQLQALVDKAFAGESVLLVESG